MLKQLLVATALICSSSLVFAWEDVDYQTTLPKGAVYCTDQDTLDKLADFAQDGDNYGAQRLLDDGSCRVSNGMRIAVFQENDYAACFLAPSGNAFYTLKGFLK